MTGVSEGDWVTSTGEWKPAAAEDLRGTYRHLRAETMRDPQGRVYVETMMRAVSRALSEAFTEIARLKAELDGQGDVRVLHCMLRNAGEAMAASLGEDEGAIMRATDTGDEWVMGPEGWAARA